MLQIVMLMIMFLLHLINTLGLKILFELLGKNSMVLGLDIRAIFLAFKHCG